MNDKLITNKRKKIYSEDKTDILDDYSKLNNKLDDSSIISQRIHICEKCLQSFLSRNKLFGHIRSVHNDSSAVINNNNVFDKNSNASQSITFSNENSKYVEIVYENDNYLILVKPQGLPTMGTTNGDLSLQNIPMLSLPNKSGYKRATPCHRLDKATGGLVLCSKTYDAEVHIRKSFQYKCIRKRYRAVVVGLIKPQYGEIIYPVDSKYAHSVFKVVGQSNSVVYGPLTTLDLWPITGRTHQLRKHLISVGYPIVGDQRYSYSLSYPCDNTPMFLWALEMEFPDPSYPHPVKSHTPQELNEEALVEDFNKIKNKTNSENKEQEQEKKSNCRGVNTTTIIPLSKEELENRLQLPYDTNLCHIEIPEPEYYTTFRNFHEDQYKKYISEMT